MSEIHKPIVVNTIKGPVTVVPSDKLFGIDPFIHGNWNRGPNYMRDQYTNTILSYIETDPADFADTLIEILKNNPKVMEELQKRLDEVSIKEDIKETIED